MRIFTCLAVFIVTGLFLVSFTDNAKAGNIPFPGDLHVCVHDCEVFCDDLVGECLTANNCESESGKDKVLCETACQICNDCCYYECLDLDCGLEQRKMRKDRALCNRLECTLE